MTNGFLDHRARIFLARFIHEVDGILESFEGSNCAKSELDERVELLRGEIEKELTRIARRHDPELESYSYKPALDESSLYIDHYFAAGSSQEAFGALYDVQISIGHYLQDLEQ